MIHYIDAWRLKGLEVLEEYREAGISDIPIKEFYRARIGDDEGYRVWENYRFARSNVSDDYYGSLTLAQQADFVKNEMNRWRNGAWVEYPSWMYYDKEKKAELRKHNPLAGRVQVLPGCLYFMLNYMVLENRDKNGELSFPSYNRRDALVLDICDTLKFYPLLDGQNRQGLLYSKPRGVHFTTCSAAMILCWILSYPGFKTISTIDVQSKCRAFGQELDWYYNRLPEWAQSYTPEGRALFGASLTDTRADVFLQFWDDKKRKLEPRESSVLIRGSKPSELERQRADFLFSDEIGKYEHNLIKVMDQAGACLIGSDQVRVGFHLAGGTSDANNMNVRSFENMHRNSKLYNMFSLFSGVQHYRRVDERTGFAPEEKIIEEQSAAFDAISLSGDSSLLISQKCINPIHISHCFYVAGSVSVDIDKVNAHLRYIKNQIDTGELSIQRGFFKYGSNFHAPEFIPDPDGGWYIYEHPTEDLKRIRDKVSSQYVAGSDNVDMHIHEDTAKKVMSGKTRLSKQAMCIMNSETKTLSAMYLYRFDDPRKDFEQKLLAAIYYNCKILSEKNKKTELNWFVYDYQNPAFNIPVGYTARYMKRTPLRFGSGTNSIEYGVETQKNKVRMYAEYLVPYVNNNTAKINFEVLLADLAKWNVETDESSPDSAMALLMTTIHLADTDYIQKATDLQITRRMGLRDFYNTQPIYNYNTQKYERRQ